MAVVFKGKKIGMEVTIKGEKGDKGDTGAKIVSTELIGQDENGGNIYKQTFDDGSTATFTAPKGDKGDKGEKGDTGEKGDKGDTGAKIVSTELIGQDENGGNIYKQTFDDGSTATFTAPKGDKGETGPQGPKGDTGAKIYAHNIQVVFTGSGYESGIVIITLLNNDNTAISDISDVVNNRITAVRGYYYNGTKDCIVYDAKKMNGLYINYINDGVKEYKNFAKINLIMTDTVTEIN